MVQWLRLRVLNAGSLSSIPGQGTRSHVLQLKKKKNRSKHGTQQESQAPWRHEAPRILGPREKDRGCQDQEHVKQHGTSPHCSLLLQAGHSQSISGIQAPWGLSGFSQWESQEKAGPAGGLGLLPRMPARPTPPPHGPALPGASWLCLSRWPASPIWSEGCSRASGFPELLCELRLSPCTLREWVRHTAGALKCCPWTVLSAISPRVIPCPPSPALHPQASMVTNSTSLRPLCQV